MEVVTNKLNCEMDKKDMKFSQNDKIKQLKKKLKDKLAEIRVEKDRLEMLETAIRNIHPSRRCDPLGCSSIEELHKLKDSLKEVKDCITKRKLELQDVKEINK